MTAGPSVRKKRRKSGEVVLTLAQRDLVESFGAQLALLERLGIRPDGDEEDMTQQILDAMIEIGIHGIR